MQEANEEQKHEKDRSHLITEHSKSGREWMHLCKQLLSSSFLTLRNFETPLCGSRIVTILMNTPRTGNVSRSEAPRKRELLRALLFLARPLLLSLLGVNPFAYIQRSTQMEMAASLVCLWKASQAAAPRLRCSITLKKQLRRVEQGTKDSSPK